MGIVLLNLVFYGHSMTYEDSKKLVSSIGGRIGTEEMSQMLKKADPDDVVGSVSVKKLSQFDDIKIYHCTNQELEARKEICEGVVSDKDLHRFCTSRFDELVNFCIERFEVVVRAADKHLSSGSRNSVRKAIRKIRDSLDDPAKLGQAIARHITTETSYNTETNLNRDCREFRKSIISAETILKYGSKKFADLSIYSDFLSDQYIIYELCQAWTKKAGSLA